MSRIVSCSPAITASADYIRPIERIFCGWGIGSKYMFLLKFLGKQLLGAGRSGQWPAIRKEHLSKHQNCVLCGGAKKVEVHHIIPFSIDPDKELEPNNLITLCKAKNKGVNCHLFFGHLGNYKRYNPDVIKDTGEWYNKINS